ncbi:hypothetical protein FAES_2120 [Fibrella aestuarina BUZ 2]|uniref:Uncharacterized protein n=1 Tax=Fibrella aestuarina BUZ 2 TaxID=1166018 RepID=I0K7M6_9BACT|nr:hypothetical protein [Fibrella aestuarina]CCH00129.1 hypothetical protein FAES_2120 [Fibrella aestuarina BUZ 2]
MHGTIIHYDTLTQCGLLRTEAGQLHYFRRDDVAEATGFAAGRQVSLRAGTLADTGGSQMDIVEGLAAIRHVEQARRVGTLPAQPAPPPPKRATQSISWVGGWLSLAALLCLLLAGGNQFSEPSVYAAAAPKLIGSVFGVAAAVLLVILAILFFTHKTRRLVRWTYWLTVWSSLFAYIAQTIDGFEIDAAATCYGYSLIALLVAVFFVRK